MDSNKHKNYILTAFKDQNGSYPLFVLSIHAFGLDGTQKQATLREGNKYIEKMVFSCCLVVDNYSADCPGYSNKTHIESWYNGNNRTRREIRFRGQIACFVSTYIQS